MFTKSHILALAAAAVIAAPAHAATSESKSVEVRYSDLNLASEEGQNVLEQRLDRAAREVCRMDEQTTGTRIPSRDASACYSQARADLSRQFADVVRDSRRGG